MVEQSSARDRLSAESVRARGLVLAAAMMAIVLTATEGSIVATAMPTIVAELGGFRLFSWAFAAFLLTQAVSIPIYGRLADLYGRKPVFFAGTSLFLAASLLCGLAWGMGSLIIFRALQGAGEEHRLAPIKIGQAAIDRDRHRLGQQKGCERPTEQTKPAELGDDRRHRSSDNRALRGGQDDRHHRGRKNQPAGANRFGGKTISGGRLFDHGKFSKGTTEPSRAIYERHSSRVRCRGNRQSTKGLDTDEGTSSNWLPCS